VAGVEIIGVPGEQVITLFLNLLSFLHVGWGSLVALVTAALSLGMQNVRQDNWE
jgi:hypothetical protein